MARGKHRKRGPLAFLLPSPPRHRPTVRPRALSAPAHRRADTFENSRGRRRAGTAGHVDGSIGQPRPSATPARRELERRARRSGLPTPQDRRLGHDGRDDPYARQRELYGAARGRGRRAGSGSEVPARVEVTRRLNRNPSAGRHAHSEFLPPGPPYRGRARRAAPLPGTQVAAKAKGYTGAGAPPARAAVPNPRTSGRAFAQPDPTPGGSKARGGHPYWGR